MSISIKDAASLPRVLGKQPFSKIVQECCGHEVLPIDMQNSDDKKLIDTITKAMENFLKTSRRDSTRYRANRANDAGKNMEGQIVEEMRKTDLNPLQLGFTPYIPFKKGSKPDSRGAPAWRQMYEHFLHRQEDFMEHYHQRSNVETCFHMLKSRYGTHLYTKHFTANANEIKTRVLCHNICVLLQEALERGIIPKFEDCVKTLSACVETP